MTPTAMNAGRKHNPVGKSSRIDSFAASRSICERSSQSNCSIAASNRFSGEAPLDYEAAKTSRTNAMSSPDGHA